MKQKLPLFLVVSICILILVQRHKIIPHKINGVLNRFSEHHKGRHIRCTETNLLLIEIHQFMQANEVC